MTFRLPASVLVLQRLLDISLVLVGPFDGSGRRLPRTSLAGSRCLPATGATCCLSGRVPARPTEEVVALGKIAAEYGGMHISHIRDEADGLLDSVRETIEIGEKGGLPTQLTHHKAIGPPNWGDSAKTLQLVEDARARGVDVSIDQYPYTASSTGSAAIYPPWIQEGGREKMVARLKDPKLKERIKKETIHSIRTNRGGGDPSNVQFAFCKWDTSLNGKTLADVTRDRGREVTLENDAVTAVEIESRAAARLFTTQ